MHLLGQRMLGIAILLLLGTLVIVKRVAAGSILDKPRGTLLIQLANVFNLLFLLVLNPLAAVLLITGRLAVSDPTHMTVDEPWLLVVLEIVGSALYVIGYVLMAWALITLGRSYQPGGSAPRSGDRVVMEGPYGLVRHPMYAAALGAALGLACLIQSWAVLSVFCIYAGLVPRLISVEEDELMETYGEQYGSYQQETRKLIPSVY